MAGDGRAGRKRSPGWESFRGRVGVRGRRAQQPQNTPGETSGGGYTTAPVKSSSAKGWGEAGMEGRRSEMEEENSQGRTTGNGEGGNTCELSRRVTAAVGSKEGQCPGGCARHTEGTDQARRHRRRDYRQEQKHPEGRNKTQGTKQRLCAQPSLQGGELNSALPAAWAGTGCSQGGTCWRPCPPAGLAGREGQAQPEYACPWAPHASKMQGRELPFFLGPHQGGSSSSHYLQVWEPPTLGCH